MIRFSVLALAASAVLCVAPPAWAQMPTPLPPEALVDQADAAKVDWLKGHVVADGPVAGGLTFTFPSDFYGAKLILLGESHGVAAPQIVDLELLTHLNARIGLTDYLAEVDPVQGAMLNRYLETGDEAVLDRVFDFWTESGAQWGNTAFEAKVRGIRALNETLPEAQRVRFLGVDAIQDWPLFGEWIAAQGGTIDAAALAAAAENRADRATLADMALAAVATLPEQTPETARLTKALQDLKAGVGREATIFNAYAGAVTSGELGDRPAYGLWGFFHVLQSGANGATPFAAMVKASDLPAADRMVSIVLHSLDSAVQIPAPLPTGIQRMRLTQFNIDGPFVKVQGSATLRAATEPGRITLFDPRGEDSPVEGGDFVSLNTSVQQFTLDQPTAPVDAYVHYVGVFRDSDWAAPRE